MFRVFALAALLPIAAQAAPQCGPRADVMIHLAERYGETRQAIGLTDNGLVLEVFANADARNWTITATTPQGETCLVASGQGYEAISEALPPMGVPG